MGRNPEGSLSRRFSLDWISTSPTREYDKGFEECKRRVMEILKKDLIGVNSCDQYYIDKIKKL